MPRKEFAMSHNAITSGTYLLPKSGITIGRCMAVKSNPQDVVMRAKLFLILSVVAVCLISAPTGRTEDTNSGRKVVQKASPVYPVVAKTMHLSGTVKLIALVAPNGKVKNVEPLGGPPILIQAAKDAISQWKFAPAAAESREVIEIHFAPGE
jgi:TonB family protein